VCAYNKVVCVWSKAVWASVNRVCMGKVVCVCIPAKELAVRAKGLDIRAKGLGVWVKRCVCVYQQRGCVYG
jgi:hypothetical protein